MSGSRIRCQRAFWEKHADNLLCTSLHCARPGVACPLARVIWGQSLLPRDATPCGGIEDGTPGPQSVPAATFALPLATAGRTAWWSRCACRSRWRRAGEGFRQKGGVPPEIARLLAEVVGGRNPCRVRPLWRRASLVPGGSAKWLAHSETPPRSLDGRGAPARPLQRCWWTWWTRWRSIWRAARSAPAAPWTCSSGLPSLIGGMRGGKMVSVHFLGAQAPINELTPFFLSRLSYS
jgi:hypothetical protein